MEKDSVNGDMKIWNTPDIIYHYCSFATFCNIVRSRSFWLSDYRTTNDSSERNVITGDILSNVIEEIKGESYLDQDDIFFKTVKKHFSLNNTRDVYLGSFCEDNDLLELWSRYGDAGRGIAIGFNPSYFSLQLVSPFFSSEATKNIGLHPVDYDIIRTKKSIKGIIYYFLQLYRKENDKTRSFQMMLCSAELVKYSNIAKHAAFYGEKEWRIMYAQCTTQAQKHNMFSDIKTREDRIKYIEMFFNANKESQPITNITIGPIARVNKNDIEEIFSRYDYKDVNICKSKIPYREKKQRYEETKP